MSFYKLGRVCRWVRSKDGTQDDSEDDSEEDDEETTRTLTAAEEAGLDRLAGAAAAARVARLALYRRAAFGLANAAEQAALAAANPGWHPRGAVADPMSDAEVPGDCSDDAIDDDDEDDDDDYAARETL